MTVFLNTGIGGESTVKSGILTQFRISAGKRQVLQTWGVAEAGLISTLESEEKQNSLLFVVVNF